MQKVFDLTRNSTADVWIDHRGDAVFCASGVEAYFPAVPEWRLRLVFSDEKMPHSIRMRYTYGGMPSWKMPDGSIVVFGFNDREVLGHLVGRPEMYVAAFNMDDVT